MSSYRPLFPDEVRALQAFANHNGRAWKKFLIRDWEKARIWCNPSTGADFEGVTLHSLRNSHGPSWLHSYRLPD